MLKLLRGGWIWVGIKKKHIIKNSHSLDLVFDFKEKMGHHYS